MFLASKHFQPSLITEGKTGAYHSRVHIAHVLTIKSDLILGFKYLQGINTLAYCAMQRISDEEKSFQILTSGPNVIKLSRPLFMNVHNKLECLLIAGLSSLISY